MKWGLTTALVLLGTRLGMADVVINELHYNPPTSQGDDNFYEFLELVNTGAAEVDLGGWVLSGVAHTFAPGTLIPAGGYLVLAKDAATIQTAYGLTGVVQWGSGNLDNGGELVRLQDAAFAVVDEVLYDDTAEWDGPLADGGGSSLELKNPALNNNTVSSWGASSTALGTPGAQNSIYESDAFPSVSGLAHLPLQPNSTDAVTLSAQVQDDQGLLAVTLSWDTGGTPVDVPMTANGNTWSALIGPFADGTVVNVTVEAEDTANQVTTSNLYSFFVTDDAVTDADIMFTEVQYTDACFGGDDWVELHNASGADLDLGGWIFKDNDDTHVFTLPAGTLIPAGGYLVLAQNAAQLTANYGISNVVGDFGFGLSSTGDAVRLFTPWGVVVDQVSYDIVAPWPGPPVGSGPSLSLLSPALDNSLGSSWAPSGAPCGTPGLANASDIWPPVVTLAGFHSADRVRVFFNENVDAASAGTPSHYSLDGLPCLGASLVDSVTVALDFGVLSVQGQTYQLSVAGVQDLAGNASLAVTLPLVYWPAGSVVVNEILQNPLAVSDDFGEWFEVYNPNAFAVNLRNWWLEDEGTDSHLISPDADLVCAPGGYLVLAMNGNPAENGGVTPDYVYSGVTLTNGADELILRAGLTVVDRVAYDGGPTFPDPNGASMELKSTALDNALAASWLPAYTSFGAGDLGTPGALNSVSSLAAPQLGIQVAGGLATLSWTAVPGALEYELSSAPAPDGPWMVEAVTAATTLSLPQSTALRFYEVRARN
ncbi:MAG: lamin tail domain-containing protein [Candidatus Delongbacteria bacterium]